MMMMHPDNGGYMGGAMNQSVGVGNQQQEGAFEPLQQHASMGDTSTATESSFANNHNNAPPVLERSSNGMPQRFFAPNCLSKSHIK